MASDAEARRTVTFEPDAIASATRQQLSPLLADWLEIALAVHAADRLSPRRSGRDTFAGLQWRRSLEVRVAVREPRFWQRPDVHAALETTLTFLTGDSWILETIAGCTARHLSEVQLPFPIHRRPANVALFSGGLDSFAGAAQLTSDGDADVFLVSGVPSDRHAARQRAQISALRQAGRFNVVRVSVPYEIERNEEDAFERTQRARAFLHVTMGCVTAILAGTARLFVFENGIGAINLPLDATQLGTSNARAAHPTFFLHMQALANLVTSEAFFIVNPFQFITKGEACRHPAVQDLAGTIGETFSCDGFPVRMRNRAQCGGCTACVLRRVALAAADLAHFDDGSRYLRDVCAEGQKRSPRASHAVAVMEWQSRTLAGCLRASNPWRKLVSTYPELQRAARALAELTNTSEYLCAQRLIRLYARHVAEWTTFPGRVCAVRTAA